MNVIFTYKQTLEFSEEVQARVDKVQFSQVPEMRVLVEELDEATLKTIPFQANISEEEFQELFDLLSEFGEVEVVGKWNNNGSMIELVIEKYRDAIHDVETFIDVVIINGVDYTGREEEFVPEPKLDEGENPVLDEEGNQIYLTPSYRRYKKVGASERPTIEQAENTQVNVFNASFIRVLKEQVVEQ